VNDRASVGNQEDFLPGLQDLVAKVGVAPELAVLFIEIIDCRYN
jgi:hypothetical protein